MRLLTLRRKFALFVCPELRVQPCAEAIAVSELNSISALLVLADTFQAYTGLSDWEIAGRAGVNNRAVKILREGRAVHQKTAARLFEFFTEAWPSSLPWPLEGAAAAHFGTVLTIPVIEMVGGPDAMLRLIKESGRKAALIDFENEKAQRSTAAPDDESPLEMFRRALEIEGRAEAGERIGREEARWLERFKESATYRSQRKMYEDFGSDMLLK